MNLYRITRKKYKDDLMGTGSRIYGGRWNPPGVSILYTAGSRALAAMELAIRMDISDLMEDLVITKLSLSPGRQRELVGELDPGDFPERWNNYPQPESAQKVGRKFVEEEKYLALKVPSVAIEGDFIYLINPQHPDFKKNVRIIQAKYFSYKDQFS